MDEKMNGYFKPRAVEKFDHSDNSVLGSVRW